MSDRFGPWLLWALLMLLVPCLTAAQTDEPASPAQLDPGDEIGAPLINVYTRQDYNAYPQNWAIVQDHRGIIYVANNNGVLEYDGVTWRLHTIEDAGIVDSLAIGEDGLIYVGSDNQIGYLVTSASGKTKFVSLVDRIPEDRRSFGSISDITVTPQGIYFSTEHTIFRWFEDEMSTVQTTGVKQIILLPVGDRIYLRDDAAQQKDKLYLIDQLALVEIPLPAALVGEPIAGLFPWAQDKVLVLSRSGKLFVYDIRLAQQHPEQSESPGIIEEFHAEIGPYLQENQVFEGHLDRGGLYIFHTRLGGVVIMDQQGKLVHLINEHRGLLNNLAWCSFVDRDNNLWIGHNDGISYVHISSPLSRHDALSGLDSVALDTIRHRGTLYMSGFEGVWALKNSPLEIDEDRHQFEQVSGISSIGIFAMEIMGERLYAFPGGDKKSFLIEELAARKMGHGMLPKVACACRPDKFPNHLFFGYFGSGFGAARFDPHTGAIDKIYSRLNHEKFTELKSTVYNMHNDREGNLWLRSPAGIFQVRFTGESVTDFELRQQDTENVGATIDRLHPIGQELFGGTEKGLYKLVPDNNQNTGYAFAPATTIGNGRLDQHDQVQAVYGLNAEVIVAKVASGFALLRKGEDGHYRLDSNALKKMQVLLQQAYIEPDGVIWFGANDGLYRYDPRKKKDYQAEFSALIRSVTVGDGEPLFDGNYYESASGQGAHFRKTSLVQPQSLKRRLPYTQNRLRFTFAAPFYENPELNQFSYQLEGFDDDFSEWSSGHEKEYTNLAEGDYRFVVKAKNIFEVPSEPAIFEFTISAPWYRTIWAYIGYVVLFVGLMVVSLRLYNRRLLAAKKRLEQIVAERTRQVRQQKDQLEAANKALWGEMHLAKKIQTTLLPEQPKIPGYNITAFMRPADEVGGDYYDVINAKNADWIMIGDVSGHGVPAGLVMMMVQTSVRTALEIHRDASTDKVLAYVNRVISRNIQKLGESKYMTITVFSVQPDGKVFYSGLHQDILIYRADSRQVEQVHSRGMWIGILDDVQEITPVDELQLGPDDVMLLYTDGISEAMNEQEAMFSVAQLVELLTEYGTASVGEIEERILGAMKGYESDDDITLIVLKRKPAV